MTNHTTTPAPTYWGRPVRYTVAMDGGAKLYATDADTTRTVTTLRAVSDKAAAKTLADDLTSLIRLADLGPTPLSTLPSLTGQLALAFATDAATFSNLAHEADDTVGIVLDLSQVLDMPAPAPHLATEPALWLARPLLRLLTATAAEPEATRRALTSELRTILEPLDGTVVRADYEAAGWLNVAPWVDTLDAEQLQVLLLQDSYEHDDLCRDLLGAWSNAGGLLEEHADRIEYDTDFRLLVNQSDVVRRLAARKPHLLSEIYTDDVIADMGEEVDELREAAELAERLISTSRS